ncbi:MAG: 7-cyano-7-deazaguanine synthase QueC [Rhodospirillaceae bacterium]
MTEPRNRALVLFSGGQDSATCLAWALERFGHVETVGFEYGQRHAVEMTCRQRLRAGIAALKPHWAARLGPDHVRALDALHAASPSALTRDGAIETPPGQLPTTFVPGRNLVFLTFAAILADQRGLGRLVGGMCETDYSGYPDCRDDTVKALQLALNLGMDRRFVIETPLMWLDKAASWRLAAALGGERLVELIRVESHTCYQGDRSVLHEWGYGCGCCPACTLRASGWETYRGGLSPASP